MINIKTLDTYTKNVLCKIFYIKSVNERNFDKEIHRHNFFQIILLKKGSIKHWIDFEETESEAPYLSVTFPNQVHRIELRDDAEADILMFDETVFCTAILSNELKDYNIDLQNRLNHITNIPQEERKEIQSIVNSIRLMWSDLNPIRIMEIKFMIKIILLKAIDIAPLTTKPRNIDADILTYQKFREAVNKDFSTPKKVHNYAEELGISTKKLSAICLKYTGLSPLAIIHEKLSLELKKAFVEEGLLLKEIAFRFGFSSQSALNKFVERHFGCSPQMWRSELEKNMMGKK